MVASAAGAFTASAYQPTGATAISEVFGDGAKITTAVVTYDTAIDGTRLDTASFTVGGRQVTSVYTSQTPGKGSPAENGQYVVVELKTATALRPDRPDEGKRLLGGRSAGKPTHEPGYQPKNDKPYADTVWVTQAATVYATDGTAVNPAGDALEAVSSRVLVADDFTQHVFSDAATGINLRYNLFTPDVKPGERYPLLMFIHDASGAGKADTRHTLLQGNGATVWATPEWQAEHPCYVLAPQFDAVTVGDGFDTTEDLNACLNLLDSLIANCAIDPYRIYTTGQSMGCMSSYELMYRRPDLFASAMLVAGQWNPAVMASLSKMNLWLLSCKGDLRSSQGIEQAIEVWDACGARVVEQEWPLEATPEERAEQVAGMLRQGGNIHYTHFAGGSHNNTWRVTYYIDGVREWLFQQHRPYPADSLVSLLRDASSPAVLVAAYHGDAHGAEPSSIKAIEKAMMKGATLALVDVMSAGGSTPVLASGESLEAALDSIPTGILLLINPDSDATAKAVEALAVERGRTSQTLLYGSRRGTQLNHIARINADTADAEEVATTLATGPVAVEINFDGGSSTALADAIATIKPSTRICFNTAESGLAGSHADNGSRNPQSTWGELIDMGGTILITGQIKPLLNWLQQ